MHGSISIEAHRFQEILILKQQNVKSVTDASIWVTFISENSKEIEHSLLYSLLLSFLAVDFISGLLISLTNPIQRIPGIFFNNSSVIMSSNLVHNSWVIPFSLPDVQTGSE